MRRVVSSPHRYVTLLVYMLFSDFNPCTLSTPQHTHTHNKQMKILNSNANSMSLSKPPMLALLTNVGSNSKSTWGVSGGSSGSGYAPNTQLMEVLSCTTMTTDGNGGITAQTSNGQPMVGGFFYFYFYLFIFELLIKNIIYIQLFLPGSVASSAGMCGSGGSSSSPGNTHTGGAASSSFQQQFLRRRGRGDSGGVSAVMSVLLGALVLLLPTVVFAFF